MKLSYLNASLASLTIFVSVLVNIALAGVIQFKPGVLSSEHIAENGLEYTFRSHIKSTYNVGDSGSVYTYTGMDNRSSLFAADDKDVPVAISRTMLNVGECTSRYHCSAQSVADLSYSFEIEHDEYRYVDIDFDYMFSLNLNASGDDITTNASVSMFLWGRYGGYWKLVNYENEGELWFRGNYNNQMFIKKEQKKLNLRTKTEYIVSMRAYTHVGIGLDYPGSGFGYAEAIIDPVITVADQSLTGYKINTATITNNAKNKHGGHATQIPEPSTLAIFALGLLGLASRRFNK